MSVLIFTANNSFSQVYQLPNGNFEQWDGGNDDEPTNWNSFPSANCTLAVGCSTAKAKKHEKSTDVREGATGQYSCKIYSKSTLGVVANGALTTGQMNLGSITLTSTSNYNFTKTSDANFRQPLNAKPDSIVFWAKVVNASDESQACCHLYIHDDYDLKDPLAANPSGYEAHIVGKVTSYNFSNNGSTWQRHSVPIVYDDEDCLSDDPQYILITFSTNVIAGGGSGNDALYIDDVEFIYNPIRYEFSETRCGYFTWNDQTYTESGDYEQTFQGTPRDSVATVHLTITEAPSSDTTATACSIFTWYGQECTTSGEYYHSIPMETGCDSLITLHLTITEAPSSDTTATACDNYTWYGQECTTSGEYYHSIQMETGCDSLITLHLTLNNSVTHEFNAEAENEYTWNDSTYSISGDYEQTFDAANGCDSVVTLHLTIITTGIDETMNSEINIFPNPANDRIKIEGNDIETIRICNMLGQDLIESKNNGTNSLTISTEALEPGNYIMLIESDSQTIAKRITIMR